MKYSFEKYEKGRLGRFDAWLTIGRVMVEVSGPWSWAFQIYLASGVLQIQVWTWLLEVDARF